MRMKMNLVSLESYSFHFAFGLGFIRALTSSFVLCMESNEDIPLHTSNGKPDTKSKYEELAVAEKANAAKDSASGHPSTILQILECSRVLKWTYAYGYYLPEDDQAKRQFFDYLQGEAEAGFERLHQC